MIARDRRRGIPGGDDGWRRIMYLRDLLLYSRARSIITSLSSPEHERHRIS